MKEKNYIHKKHPNVTTAMQQTILNRLNDLIQIRRQIRNMLLCEDDSNVNSETRESMRKTNLSRSKPPIPRT